MRPSDGRVRPRQLAPPVRLHAVRDAVVVVPRERAGVGRRPPMRGEGCASIARCAVLHAVSAARAAVSIRLTRRRGLRGSLRRTAGRARPGACGPPKRREGPRWRRVRRVPRPPARRTAGIARTGLSAPRVHVSEFLGDLGNRRTPRRRRTADVVHRVHDEGGVHRPALSNVRRAEVVQGGEEVDQAGGAGAHTAERTERLTPTTQADVSKSAGSGSPWK